MAFQWEAITAMSVVLTGVGGLVTLLVNRVVTDKLKTLEDIIDEKLDKLYDRINGTYVRSGLCAAYREAEQAQTATLAANQAILASTLAKDLAGGHETDLRRRVERLETFDAR